MPAPPGASRTAFTVAATVVILAGVRAAAPITVPFLLAFFIAAITAPALFWLQRKGLPGALAVLLIVLGITLTGLGLFTLIGSSVQEFMQAAPFYQQQLSALVSAGIDWLAGHGIDLSLTGLSDVLDPGQAMRLARSLLNSFGAVLSNAFLILFTVVFMLLEAWSFPFKLRAMLRDPDHSLSQFARFFESVKKYMSIKTVISIATGALASLWLWLLGVDYPLLWGVLTFLLNYIPNIGSIIASILPTLLALVQLGFLPAAATLGGYLVINFVMGSVLEPRIMGKGVGLSTLVVFLSLIFWGWLLGAVGMLLSVPLTMMVKIAAEGHEETRWLAVLLASEASLAQSVPGRGRHGGGAGPRADR
jgi:predicted PurR-regulated permease PerM